MNTRPGAWLAIALALAGATPITQAQAVRPVPAEAVLVYVATDTGPRGNSEEQVQVRRLLLPDGRHQYRMPGSFVVIDPATLAITPSMALDKAFTFAVESTRGPEAAAPGMRWHNRFAHPPRLGARCADDGTGDYDVQVVNAPPARVRLGEAEVELPTLRVEQEGSWAQCSLRGKAEVMVEYSADLQAAVAWSVTTRLAQGSVGYRMVLKEVRPAPTP